MLVENKDVTLDYRYVRSNLRPCDEWTLPRHTGARFCYVLGNLHTSSFVWKKNEETLRFGKDP